MSLATTLVQHVYSFSVEMQKLIVDSHLNHATTNVIRSIKIKAMYIICQTEILSVSQ